MLWKLPDIRVPPDSLFPNAQFLGINYWFTNTFLLSVVGSILIIALFVGATRRASIIPTPFQNLVEWIFQGLLSLCEDVAGRKNGRRFFPWVATIFLLVLISNWWEVVPGIETIGTKASELPGCHNVGAAGLFLTGTNSNCITPWLRPPSTDLNFTIALAVVTVVMTQLYGFIVLGARVQIGRYIILSEGPIGLIVGVLEFFLELLRVLSLSFRLFGNLFAGDVLLLVMSFLVPVVGAIPFYFLEVFIGFIQAFVFAFLTLLFFTLGTTAHGHEDAEEHHAAELEHQHAALAREETHAA